eukprot:scaffold23370_cov120-Isochrysis_galbana.AAC.3
MPGSSAGLPSGRSHTSTTIWPLSLASMKANVLHQISLDSVARTSVLRMRRCVNSVSATVAYGWLAARSCPESLGLQKTNSDT